LKDPDFADDACLLSHTFVKMEKKLMEFAKCRKNCQIEDCEKTQSLRIVKSYKRYKNDIKELNKFVYLDSVVTSTCGAEEGVKTHIQ
jgi:hypothetical protein